MCLRRLVSRLSRPLCIAVLGGMLATGPLLGQDDELPPLQRYRSRLDVEPRVQSLTIAQRCSALYGLLAGWVVEWDPGAASRYREAGGVFRAAAVRSRSEAGAPRTEAEEATVAAVAQVTRLYRAHRGSRPSTAPSLEADELLTGDRRVCDDLLDIVSDAPGTTDSPTGSRTLEAPRPPGVDQGYSARSASTGSRRAAR